MRGSEEEDDQERKGFRVEVDLCIGAICSLFERERDRETEREKTEHNHNLEQIERK